MLFQKLPLCHLIKKNDINLRASGKKEEESQQKEGNLMKVFLKNTV